MVVKKVAAADAKVAPGFEGGATTLLEPPEVPVRGIGEWSD